MPESPSCTLVTLAGPSDVPFATSILKHLIRTAYYPFTEVLAVIDDLPKAGQTAEREQQLHALRAELLQLQEAGTLTRTVSLREFHAKHPAISQRHFGRLLKPVRDHRGIPLYGWIAGMEEAKTDLVFHADSDILIASQPHPSWVREAIAILTQDASVMFVAPRPGPPTDDGALRGQSKGYEQDAAGNFRFRTFSSRRFLYSKSRFQGLLPLPVLYASRRAMVKQFFQGTSGIQPWEACVSAALEKSSWVRLHLGGDSCWTLHCPVHNHEWITALPQILVAVESGAYPPGQEGHYDLDLSLWTEWLRHLSGK